MKTVGEILKAKGSQVWSVSPEDSVHDALRLMADKNVGALVVLKANEVLGIVSERDYARDVELKGRTSTQTSVGQIMTRSVIFIRPDNSVEECLTVMTQTRIRHLPVMDEDKLVGLVSIGDVAKSIISAQQVMIQRIENYLMGEDR